MTLYSEIHGLESRGAREIVLLHGWGMNAAVWNPLLDALTDDYRITVLELPGHGGSRYSFSQAEFDAWVQLVLEQAPKRAIWIGWSLGGQLAQRAATLAPERIEKLLLVASNPKFVQGENWYSAMPEQTLRQFAAALLKNPAQTLERFLSLQVKGDEQARHTLRLLRQDVSARPEADALALEHGLEFLLKVDLRDQLSSITCPTLWLLGERDTLVPVSVGDELEELMPEAEVLILNGASHAPFLSHPQVAIKTMKQFLDGCP